MKRLSYYAMIGLLALPIFASAEVGVSINVGQPGFYGQINLGNAPPPQLIYAQPRWIYRGPVQLEPIYLRVPYGHAKKWRSYCGQYRACNRPVYFVRDRWYDRVYVPYYREHYVYRGDRREWKHRDRDDRRDWDRHRGGHHHDQGNRGRGHGRDY